MLQGLYSGLSALKANQIALDITSNNIANKDTLGYTKQRVNFTTNPIRDVNNTSTVVKEGTGTHIQSVIRIEDSFLYNRLNKSKEIYSNLNEQYRSLNELDEILNNSTFTSMYDNMFESLHRYTESPHNIELKYLTEENAKVLKERAEEIMEVFTSNIENNNKKIKISKDEIPKMTDEMNKLELEIKVQESSNEYSTDKTYANDMRDKRDLLETQIKEKEASIIGLQESNKNITNIKKIFSDAFSESYENVDAYLNSNMSGEDANILLEKENKIRDTFKEPFIELKNMKETSELMLGSSEVIMTSLQNKDDNISKVDLDEEMVNMMKYQKAYEASAVVIRTYDEILKTTLDLKR